MSNILMVNVPYSGHTNPTLPLASELVKRGHRVVYVNAEEFRSKIEATGVEFVAYENYPANPSEQKKKMTCFRACFDTCLNIKEKFDLLIYEMFFYPGIRVAQKLGIPCVRQFSQPAWNDRMISEASYIFKTSSKLIDIQVMGKKNKKYMGLENEGMIESVLHSKPDLNIVYVPEVFQNKRETFENNFMFTIPPIYGSVSKIEIPYDKMKKPIIYISLGSIISNKGFCKECIRAFSNKEFDVILNTGKVSPNSLGKIAENIYAYSFVPQVEVLKHAKVFLTHCGMNSVNEAMLAGVPMVAMPFINDQISNAKRVVEMGIGKRVRSFPSKGKELYDTALGVLNDEKIFIQSQQVKKNIECDTSWERVVEAVEKLIK